MNNDAITAIQTSLTKQTVVYTKTSRNGGVWGPIGTARSAAGVDALIARAENNRYTNGIMVISKTTAYAI